MKRLSQHAPCLDIESHSIWRLFSLRFARGSAPVPRFPSTCRRWQSGKTRRLQLPQKPARTRFAPSPTGFLHLGSLRTALYNYLLAKKTGGEFILRLEDTDQKRTVPGAEQRLYADLKWAGLDWDEGPLKGGPFGPYRQSERTAIYQEHANKLLETPFAYRCFCSAERLQELALHRQSLNLPTDYDRLCHGISKQESDTRSFNGERFVIRLTAPREYKPAPLDLLYGPLKGVEGIVFKHGEYAYQDPILLKGDGQPTYHLANVVDDHLMNITHVIRGTEWMSSTPKHSAIYHAFGWEPPAFLHVGLLVDENDQKLSKRNFATDVQSYRDMGVFPESLVNFVALHGWSPQLASKADSSSEIMRLERLVENFNMKFTKGNAAINLDKLWFIQGNHAKRAANLSEENKLENDTWNQMRQALLAVAEAANPSETVLNGSSLEDQVDAVIELDAGNYTLPLQFYERNYHFFHELKESVREPYEPKTQHVSVETLSEIANYVFCESNDYTPDSIEKRIAEGAERHHPSTPRSDEGLAKKAIKEERREIYRYLRWIICLGRMGPSITHSIALLGPENCRSRLEASKAIRGVRPLPSMDEKQCRVSGAQ